MKQSKQTKQKTNRNGKAKAISNIQWNRTMICEIIFLVILALYPLRHIRWGLDLWDTGYSYANFQYMGMEHMDPMWLFATYLANVVGHFLTKLPFAGGLVGMNFYTGLFISLLAILGYWFCTRQLKISAGTTFLGEFVAISLCWCPMAILYNYLTYVFFLLSVIFLYQGLVKEKKWFLFLAGVFLGTNILVRFSNLAEAGMIVAVWAYGFIEYREGGEKCGRKTLTRTLWCLGGYLTAFFTFMVYISIRYGLNAYIEGIQRLFGMTDKAEDYKPASMVTDLIYTYVENLYWVVRIGVIVAGGIVLFAVVKWLVKRYCKQYFKVSELVLVLVWDAVCIAMLVWLYIRGFCATQYNTYGAMLRPGITFLTLAMAIAVVRIFHKKAPKQEKLISGILILVIILTSIGSNNGVYPSLNNLFIAAPYTFWQSSRFIWNVKNKKVGQFVLASFPVKMVLVAFLFLFTVQSVLFGANFVFAEGTGVTETSAEVGNNDILDGVRMPAERAVWMSTISAYVEERNLKGKDVILYGSIPALSYYLEMPSAFNPWSDLLSYSSTAMELAITEVSEEMRADGKYRPVVIVEDNYAEYLLGNLAEKDTTKQGMDEDEKWQLLVDFMKQHGYVQTFHNEKFSVWE